MNNKINNNIVKKLPNQIGASVEKLPTAFKITERLYNEFLENLEKSDLANSSSRYLSELAQVKNLKDMAKQFNLTEKLEHYTKIETEILEKLIEFGIKMQ